jgi:hypothetical protein
MDSSDKFDQFDLAFTFRRRPISIPATLRPLWAITTICLLLRNCCRGAKSSRGKLHVLYWAVRSAKHVDALILYLNGQSPRVSVVVRYDPSFDYALTLAAGKQLLEFGNGGQVVLTEKGQSLVDKTTQADLFPRERASMAKIRFRLTEQTMQDLTAARA